jgi:uncharacterized membrane protein
MKNDRNTIEATVEIERPVHEVFAFYRDFGNLPRFLGDVLTVEPTGESSYRWTIQGPLGIRLHWTIRVTGEQPDTLIRYETIGLWGLKGRWEIYFAHGAHPDSTEVRERMTAPLGMLWRAVLALMGKFPEQEVKANLHRFKQLMETGSVTDTRYSVAGKFAQQHD